jgi:hypothetical protein
MHISETKHHLRPYFFKRYSQVFLNLDRGIAVLVFLYIAGLVVLDVSAKGQLDHRYLAIAGRFLLGALASGLGELTNNLYWYLPLHTIWHYCAFSSITAVVNGL